MAEITHATREVARLPWIVPPLVVACVVLPFAWFIFGPRESLLFVRGDGLSSVTAFYLHGLIEWTAACAAITTSFLAFVHFGATKSNPTMALIAPIFLFAGVLDAIHALASIDLLRSTTLISTLIPLTWAVGRFYVALGLTMSSVLLIRGRLADRLRTQALLNIGLGIASVGAMYLASRLPDLSDGIFSSGVARRSTDLVSLALFAFAAVYSLPRFYDRYPSLVSHALMLSMVPQVAAQAFMAFGSAKLYDAGFFFAHGMKLFAYLLPLGGIALDYVHGQRSEEKALLQAEKSRLALIEQIKDLTAQHEARQNAEAALLRQMARATLHTRIAVAANQATSFGDSLSGLMREICEYTGWIAGHVFVVDPGPPTRLVATNCWYAENPVLLQQMQTETERLSLDKVQCAASRAWASGAPVWQLLSDDASFSRSRESIPAGVKAIVAVPAMVGPMVVGVLEFFSLEPKAMAEELLETMAHVGVQFGRAFERIPWRPAPTIRAVPA